jgi:hypothetical protein
MLVQYTSSDNTEAINNKHLILTLSKIMTEIIISNSQEQGNLLYIETQKKYSFYYEHPPLLSIKNYCERVLKYTHCEESSFIISLLYIDRICEKNNFILTPNNIHKFIFIAVVMSIKYNEDECYTDNYYAKVGGVSLEEFCLLQYEFLKLIQYRMFITEGEYEKYKRYINGYSENKTNPRKTIMLI